MSISAISSSNYLYELYVNRNNSRNSQAADFPGQDKKSDPIKADLAQLWQALESGNLTTAQSLFTQLQSDLEAVGAAGNDAPVQGATASVSTDSTSSNPLANDFSSLEDALAANDLATAKEYLLNIIQHLQPGGLDTASRLDILS